MITTVTTYYLEMFSPSALRRSTVQPEDVRVARVDPPSPALNRYLYTAVGAGYYWIGRRSWSYQQWLDYLHHPAVETWLLTVRGIPAGYVELDNREGDPEIAYFGLLPTHVGRGLGGYFLTAAVDRAWQMGGRRVWLHTCTLDHPSALPAYLARGFTLYDQEVLEEDLPEQAPGPWEGCGPGWPEPPVKRG